MEQHGRIAVIGGGLAGMACALGLARTGRAVTLFAPADGRTDPRTTAVLRPAIDMLESWGAWRALEPHCAPLRTMRLIDGSRNLVRSPTVTFEAAEIGQDAFGWNVPNAQATKIVRDALDADGVDIVESRVDRIDLQPHGVTLHADGVRREATLVVGADGQNSIVRQAANIAARRWSYPQTAIVTTFGHERPHGDISTEFHTEFGPATQVPLAGSRSSLVWVMQPHEAERRAHVTSEQLSQEIAERLGYILGNVQVDGPVRTFPMRGMLAEAYAGQRAVLVGEAAHAFPPIGAQGFNLTMRDISDLVELQRDAADPGSAELTNGYQSFRRGDAQLRTTAVDALNRSLLSGLLPIQLARAGGLGALKAVPALRQFVMREGFSPNWTRGRSASGIASQVLSTLRSSAQRRRSRSQG